MVLQHTGMRWGTYLAAVAASGLLFLYLYQVSRQSVLAEIRAQAMGISMAVAAGLAAEEVDTIQTPADQDRPEFQRIQQWISRMVLHNPDVLYAYVMRRSNEAGHRATDLVYVVDQATSDDNRDGVITKDEETLPVGTPYDATDLPAMLQAWSGPAADADITRDPPYPDSISGYAPVRNARGETVAIVGTDIAASTVGLKLALVRAGNLLGFGMVSILLITLLKLYLGQRKLAYEREGLVEELREALGNIKTLSGLLPICANCKRIRNDAGDWERMESYVGKRSDAEFSHSICPECTRKLYPDVVEH